MDENNRRMGMRRSRGGMKEGGGRKERNGEEENRGKNWKEKKEGKCLELLEEREGIVSQKTSWWRRRRVRGRTERKK